MGGGFIGRWGLIIVVGVGFVGLMVRGIIAWFNLFVLNYCFRVIISPYDISCLPFLPSYSSLSPL